MRHELKHTIHTGDYLAIRSRIQWLMRRDPHAGENGQYRIRSLYFDNYQDKALREKLDGVSVREKFRLRYYNNMMDYVNLEKKSKWNQLGEKESARLTKEQCEKLLDGEYEWMPDTKNPLLREFYCKIKGEQLRPKTIVDYIREPYIYEAGNVRVTFDSQIKSGLYSQNFFDMDLPMMEAFEAGLYIMEVKFDQYLPEIIEAAIQTGDRRGNAFSKYAACRQFE